MSDPAARVRVLRVIGRLNVGGPAIHTTLLTDRLDPLRYDSRLVAGVPDAAEGDYLQLTARRSDPRLTIVSELGREVRLRNDLTCIERLTYLIQQFRPHIVHTHAAKAGTVGRVAAWLCGVPVVVHTYHGHVLRGYFSPLKERVFRAVERGLARVTDELVAVTPRVRQELLGMGIGRAERFSIVPLGFDLERFRTADRLRGELRRERGIDARVPLIGIVARLVPIKAHETFLDVVALLRRTHPEARFIIVGDGERRSALEARVQTAGLSTVVDFLGWRADLDRIYADLDVVALTSRNEGSPVALIEAMAAGRPVVSTDVGGVADVVEDGHTGWLVPVDDPAAFARTLTDVLADESARASVAQRAQATVLAKYGADRLVADVDALYTRLLQARGGR